MNFLLVACLGWLTTCNPAPTGNYSKSMTDDEQRLLVKMLTDSFDSVMFEVDSLTEEQWNFKPSENAWSVALVLEHLVTHDELFSREVRVLSQLPEFVSQPDSLFAADDIILSYKEVTAENKGKSPDHLLPLGRWCSKADAVNAYGRVRLAYIDYVESSTTDFRKYYTTSGRGPTRFRDLYQLVLISIAHTQRHTNQIRKIKSSLTIQANTD